MIRPISASALVCALFAISMTAYAQGRPAGAGSKGGGSRPSMSQQQDRSASMRLEAKLRREQAKAKRQAQQEARLAAESAHTAGPPAETPPTETPPVHAVANRAMGEAHNMSGVTPSGRQDPNANAAQEAFDAESNADNATEHGSPRNAQGLAQRETRGDDGDKADPD